MINYKQDIFKSKVSLFLIIFYNFHCSYSQLIYKAPFDTICKKSYLIDITNGLLNNETRVIVYDNVTYSNDKYFVRNNSYLGCACDVQLCIPKCCGMNATDNCQAGFSHQVNIDIHNDDLEMIGTNVSHRSIQWTYCSYMEIDMEDLMYLKPDGQLYISEMNLHVDLHKYCIISSNDTENPILIKLCEDALEDEPENTVNKYGMIISIPFLFVTLLVYLILPEKKIQTKCLMAYITCLILAYSSLTYLSFETPVVEECYIFAACGVYFFMSAFCWMNVTCVDIYWTFSGGRSLQQSKSSKWKRFGIYCMFANGAPLILLGIIFALNSLEKFWAHPGFADDQCWLANGLPQFLYFYGPMAVLLTINAILFVTTAITIRRTIVDNQRMLRGNESNRHADANKQDYRLYIKLFIAMGINWSFEFISALVNWILGHNKIEWLWYPTDFCNAIYGVVIFVIFVCKKTVWIKLRQRYYVYIGKPNMARALSTRTSGYQMSQTERSNLDDTTACK